MQSNTRALQIKVRVKMFCFICSDCFRGMEYKRNSTTNYKQPKINTSSNIKILMKVELIAGAAAVLDCISFSLVYLLNWQLQVIICYHLWTKQSNCLFEPFSVSFKQFSILICIFKSWFHDLHQLVTSSPPDYTISAWKWSTLCSS